MAENSNIEPMAKLANGADDSVVSIKSTESEHSSEESESSEDDHFESTPRTNSNRTVTLYKTPDGFKPLTEEELLALAAERGKKKPYKWARETADDTKGDTSIEFISTRRGGISVLFRDYFFRISRKQGHKSYYRCQTKGCKTTLVLENDMFKSVGGEHSHAPDKDDKLQKIEKKRQRQERVEKARASRLEKLRQKEEERRRKAEEIALKKVEESRNPQSKKEQTVDEILAMQQTHAFNHEHFDYFDNRLTKMLNCLKDMQTFQVAGCSVDELCKDWDIQRQRIRTLVVKKDRKKDKRLALLRTKLETMTDEREVAIVARKELEAKLSSVNIAGCQLLLNELNEIQRKISSSKQLDESTNISETEHAVAHLVNGELVTETPLINPVNQSDYRALYEQAIKERDNYRVKLQSMQMQPEKTMLPQVTTVAASGHQQVASMTSGGQSSIVTYEPLQTLSVPVASANHHHHYSHIAQAQLSDQHPREPQILLFEGSHASGLWRSN
ncbi:hypothetical protein HDE_03846 [Halotydeus destructor]|nr:hypothetical protein HDE_03846 [Halotydeus destructor]